VKRAARWTLVILLGLTAAAAVTIGVFMRLVPGDQELASRISAAAQESLGVQVTVRSAHLQFWPHPELVLADVATVQDQPVSLRLLVAHPDLAQLLRRRLSLRDVEIDGAVIPLLSLLEWHGKPAAAHGAMLLVPVAQLHIRHLTWITRYGKELELEGNAFLDPDGQPRQAELLRSGVQPAARLTLARREPDHWQVEMQLGGGTANGQVELAHDKNGRMQLSGTLAPHDIEVASALDALKTHSPVRGQASGHTLISASGDTIGELAGSLHTRTNFTMAQATLLHVDVAKAIRSLGKDHAGQTALRSLTGQVDTQNTHQGMVIRFTAIQAEGESFTAKGEATVAKRHVAGEMTVDVAGGLVGVPVKVSGPLGQEHLSVAMSAVAGEAAGAAVGTVILPGIGTVLGAGVGRAVGKLFGNDAPKPDGKAAR
jgi:uncharacterized protein involved in outer membrane biogenesis